jgi:hypothetical protein
LPRFVVLIDIYLLLKCLSFSLRQELFLPKSRVRTINHNAPSLVEIQLWLDERSAPILGISNSEYLAMEAPAPLVIDPNALTFLDYNPRKNGDQLGKFLTELDPHKAPRPVSRHSLRPAHYGSSDPRVVAAQFFNDNRVARSKRHPTGSRIGTRLFYNRTEQDNTLIGTYGIFFNSQGLPPAPSITAFIDHLYFPTGAEDYAPLTTAVLADIAAMANAWSVATGQPVTLAMFVSKRAFGAILAKADFDLAAEGLSTPNYGDSADLYTQTYNLKS